MTNADKIRELPNIDLADILHKCCVSCDCEDCVLETFCGVYRTSGDWLDWLESEAEECAEIDPVKPGSGRKG